MGISSIELFKLLTFHYSRFWLFFGGVKRIKQYDLIKGGEW